MVVLVIECGLLLQGGNAGLQDLGLGPSVSPTHEQVRGAELDSWIFILQQRNQYLRCLTVGLLQIQNSVSMT